MAINRKYWQWIEQAITAFWSQKLMTMRLSIGLGGLLASSVAPQVLPSWLYVYMKPHRIYAEWQNLSETHICGIHLASSIVDTNIGQHFPPGHFCSNSIKPCPRTLMLTLTHLLIRNKNPLTHKITMTWICIKITWITYNFWRIKNS